MQRCHVIVLGDLMLDEYLWGEISRISPEAPVPVMHLSRSEHTLGGAANVASNARSLGARVSAFGIVGADSGGKMLLAQLDRLNIEHEGVFFDPARPTTRKTRLMSIEHSQQVFRLDEESTTVIPTPIEEQLISALGDGIRSARVLICSDYLKGVLTKRVLSEAALLARRTGVALVTAPKDLNVDKYASASILVPNYQEFERLVGYHRNGDGGAEWMEPGASMLLERHGFEALLVTRGSAGMTLFERPAGSLLRHDIPAIGQSVYDVTGAGDTVIAVFALALAAGANRATAARFANIAAGIVVGKRGTACVTPGEFLGVLRRSNDDAFLRPAFSSACQGEIRTS
jgi:D-beta-D-heptose 7-phosphate kinase/D-beta-D-heptose 1-phosphate adenosyltransferase